MKYHGKFESPRKSRRMTMVAALALALVLTVSAGGTLAWLTANSTPVVNTFTTSDIGVELTEGDNLDLKMIPGWTITKDPKAKVTVGSEDCYLFVKIEKSENFDTFMTYEVADGWTQLTTDKDGKDLTDIVYYKVFDSKDSSNTNAKGTAYSILKNDQVSVLGTVTKSAMNALTEETKPTLTFTAYASQLYKNNTEKFTAAEAWGNIT